MLRNLPFPLSNSTPKYTKITAATIRIPSDNSIRGRFQSPSRCKPLLVGLCVNVSAAFSAARNATHSHLVQHRRREDSYYRDVTVQAVHAGNAVTAAEHEDASPLLSSYLTQSNPAEEWSST